MNLISLFESRRETLRLQGMAGPWVLVFDIDSTLMDTGPRNQAIIDSAIHDLPALDVLRGQTLDVGNSWNILAPLERIGSLDRQALLAVQDYWAERFFTDAWLAHDRPYPGVQDCLHALQSRGFTLVYLTGRHEQGMSRGTRASFRVHGLPAVGDQFFLFKPRFEDADLAFKTAACVRIAGMGSVVGTVDNEPGNVNLFARSFPDACHVWMRTITSPAVVPLVPEVVALDPLAFLVSSDLGLKES